MQCVTVQNIKIVYKYLEHIIFNKYHADHNGNVLRVTYTNSSTL